MTVTIERQGDCHIVWLDNPPVNALSIANGYVSQIRDALAMCLADEACSAIVMTARGRFFRRGADINDFEGDPHSVEALRALMNSVESSSKPVVMALHGMVLGGGLELALARHMRIVHVDTRLGFPEVKLGLLPGAAGTQRTPRLAGAAAKLDLMLSERTTGAIEAEKLSLIDQVSANCMAAGPRPTFWRAHTARSMSI